MVYQEYGEEYWVQGAYNNIFIYIINKLNDTHKKYLQK